MTHALRYCGAVLALVALIACDSSSPSQPLHAFSLHLSASPTATIEGDSTYWRVETGSIFHLHLVDTAIIASLGGSPSVSLTSLDGHFLGPAPTLGAYTLDSLSGGPFGLTIDVAGGLFAYALDGTLTITRADTVLVEGDVDLILRRGLRAQPAPDLTLRGHFLARHS
jgi:hypothetical protein